MIKLFSLKQQKKDGTDPNCKTGMGQKKSSAAQLRITKGKDAALFQTSHFLSSFRLSDTREDQLRRMTVFSGHVRLMGHGDKI